MSKNSKLSLLELSSKAFSNNVGEKDIFSYSRYETLKTILNTTISQRSMALVTGKAGIGKTTTVRAITSSLPSNRYLVLYFGQDQHGGNLLRRFALALGIKPKHYRKDLPMQVSQVLTDNSIDGGKEVVAIVDEAHLLDEITLEDIRLLTNSEFDTVSPISIMLLGLPQLRLQLKASSFEALNQRLRYRYFLEGFSKEETFAYIKHRLGVAGGAENVFVEDALLKIFDASEGVPREINNLCSLALLQANMSGLESVNGKLMKQVVTEREFS